MPSDPPPALSGVEGPWSEKRRLHPWSLLFLLAGQLRQFAAPVIIALVLGSRSRETAWQIYALPLLIPYALYVVVRYLTFTYTFGDGELVIRSGLFFKNERHVPYSRVQNVDAVQNAMHRLSAWSTSGSTRAAARRRMRRSAWSRGRRTRRSAGGCSTSDRSRAALTTRRADADHTILALRPRDLAVLGLIENRAAVLVGAVVGLLWETGMLGRAVSRVGIDVAGEGAVRRVLVSIFRDGTLPFDDLFRAGAAIVGLLIVLRILSVVWAIVRLYGFRLTLDRRRSADRVRPAHTRVGDGAAAPHSDVDGPARAHSSLVRSGLGRRSKRREVTRQDRPRAGANRWRRSSTSRSCPPCSASSLPDLSLEDTGLAGAGGGRVPAASCVRGWCSR